ncbi:DNA helicase II [Alteracholeplasma palmae J233]|uniref:DNA 3'-5' helicase n=1 Tax=Alteracholeplasma palmae (strain ATCC 49389 / J233) TaxID=1318466 RepID=U4KJS9_ALTPJ|nr:UvrD-helicase domain-containing protein [Alteracholeplasma palmae]CCV63702.1 DNA helicase II [Alteracholeplasma palmae J233]
MHEEPWLLELNDKQKQAVTFTGGALYVVAGAGTGKTKTLTARIAYLIKYIGVPSHKILAVTFTNKAAREMKERIVDMVGPYAQGTWLYTFHAFGLQVLRQFIEELPYGYNTRFSILDDDDSKKIIKDVTKALNLDSKVYPVRSMRNKISTYKTEKSDVFEDENEKRIFKKYQESLRSGNVLDFDDLLIYTYELLMYHDHVREYLQNKFDYILVDEFQDTDKMQYSILSILADKHRNLFLVGDPDQSIYSFRGADYNNTKKFLTDFGSERYILDQNYRSTNNILEKANMLIKNNSNRPFNKELESNLGTGERVIFSKADSDYQEATIVSREIQRLIRSENYKYEDIAILYRNNSLSRLFEDSFIQMGIPYVVYGGISFYERKEIKDILAYIRVIVDPHQDFYLKRIINEPKRQLGQMTVAKIEEYAQAVGLSIFNAIDTVAVNKPTQERLKVFKALILEMRHEIENVGELKDIVNYVGNASGYIDMLKAEKDDISQDRIDNINELKSVFSQADSIYEGNNIEKLIQLLDQISLYTDLDKKDASDDVVKLSTFHQVKGLEFKVVFMVAQEEGIFPSQRSLFEADGLEEERRIAYVGVTRAKERLYLTYAQQRMMYGQIGMSTASRFIKEMQLAEENQRPYYNEVNTPLKTSQVTNNRFNPGEKVSHIVFGEGVVIRIDDDIATIAFSMPHGIKKLLQTHPSIKKIEK